jgi:hypothetical protein
MQVGLDLVTSAICKSQLQFRLTNIYQLLFLISTTYFQSAAVMGRRNSISPPAQSPARCHAKPTTRHDIFQNGRKDKRDRKTF